MDARTRARLNPIRRPETAAGPVAARTECERRRDPGQADFSNETVGQAKWDAPLAGSRRKSPLDNMDTHLSLDRTGVCISFARRIGCNASD